MLVDAARTEPELEALAAELSRRRIGHTRLLVAHLAEIEGLHEGVGIETAADVL